MNTVFAKYICCDMMPESRNNLLLSNGSDKHISVEANARNNRRVVFLWSALRSLLCNGAVNISLQQ
jgi:hypothetical protein